MTQSVKLQKIIITHFKGINEFTLIPEGREVNVYGENGAGKTTIFDAFTWGLFDKDSLDRKTFGIKPEGEAGQPEHGNKVEIWLALGDGSPPDRYVKLEKLHIEKWTKPRGKALKEFTGHTTDYWIDGVPASKAEYDKFIADFVEEDVFRLLSNPRYFNEVLHWQKKRDLLLAMCGVSEETLKSHSDKVRICKEKKTSFYKALMSLPVRIDEVRQGLTDTPPAMTPEDLDKLRGELTKLQEKRVQIEAGGAVAVKTKELREVEALIIEESNKLNTDQGGGFVKGQSVLREISEELFKLSREMGLTEQKITLLNDDIKRDDDQRDELREIYDKLVESKPSENTTICSLCKQNLPQDQIKEATANFNRVKSIRLEAMNKQGLELKAKSIDLVKQIDALEKDQVAAREELARLEALQTKLQDELKGLSNQTLAPAKSQSYLALENHKDTILRGLEALKDGTSDAVKGMDREIQEVMATIREQEGIQAIGKAQEQGLQRIKDLELEQKTKAKEYEGIEKELYEAEEKVRDTVKALEDEINQKFELVSFKLFNVLVNGGIEECCDASYNGTLYRDMSNSERIRAGLDIIRTLSGYYGVSCPLFIDNREAITELPDMDCQVISLIVSPDDTVLRMQVV